MNAEYTILQFVGLVTWPLNGSEGGVDLVSIETSAPGTTFIVQIRLFPC